MWLLLESGLRPAPVPALDCAGAEKADKGDKAAPKTPCILHLDSMKGGCGKALAGHNWARCWEASWAKVPSTWRNASCACCALRFCN